MTIPSSLLIREIMHYETFSPKPRLSRIGMPCIGYGFPLWEESLDIVHGNTKLAKHIKSSMPKDMENSALCIQRLLQIPVSVTEETAQKLLIQSLLYYADTLSQRYAGFRHITNQCGTAVIYPHSSLASYEKQLVNLTCRTERTNSQNTQKSKNQIPYCFSKQNSTEQPIHSAFLQTYYSSSAAFAGANPFQQSNFFTKPKKGKHRKKVLPFLPLTAEEKALLRVDSVLFVTHLLGLEITLRMHDFFFALEQDNYLEASNQLLSHRAASYLGAVMAILARRIREASLDLRDITRQKANTPTMLLHRKKAKNYFLHNADFQQKNCRQNGKNQITDGCYGA